MRAKTKLKPGKQNDMNITYCPLKSLEDFAGRGFHFFNSLVNVNIHVQMTYTFSLNYSSAF